jgi:tetratricopeptide (TPR) repeat protein
MISISAVRAPVLGAPFAAAAWLIGAASLSVNIGAAQESPDLGNPILVPMALATALESPLKLGRTAIDTPALLATVNRHLAAIDALEDAGSPNAELIEQLGLLAVAYQQLERHEEAIEALEDAIDLTVKDGGRRNLEQIPLQVQKVPSYMAANDIRRIDDTEELIYTLYERSLGPSDRQMYYATINLADWLTTAYYKENYAAASRALRRQRAVVPRVQRCIRRPGSGGADPSACPKSSPSRELENDLNRDPSGTMQRIFSGEIKDISKQDINDTRLRKIDRLYANYQDALLAGNIVQLDIIMDMAKRIARLAYATKQEMDFERDNYVFDPVYEGSREQAVRNSPVRMDASYDSGVAALNYAIDVPSSVTGWRPEGLAAALLDLADWHLAYGKVAAAEETYRRAYDVLIEAGFSSENIDLGLATELPTRIPVFATHLYTRRTAGMDPRTKLDFAGYVDVSFTVDGLGNARGFEVLGRSGEDASEIERLIERQSRSAKFRPVLRGGELIGPERYEVRYYYSY